MGGKAIGGALGLGAKGVSSAVKNPLMSTAAATAVGGSQGLLGRKAQDLIWQPIDAADKAFNKRVVKPIGTAIQARAAKSPGSTFQKRVADATLMHQYPKESTFGFGQGLVQGAENTLPGRGLSAVSSLFGQ